MLLSPTNKSGPDNLGFVERVSTVADGDADRNALVILEMLCQMMADGIAENLSEIEHLFVDE